MSCNDKGRSENVSKADEAVAEDETWRQESVRRVQKINAVVRSSPLKQVVVSISSFAGTSISIASLVLGILNAQGKLPPNPQTKKICHTTVCGNVSLRSLC